MYTFIHISSLMSLVNSSFNFRQRSFWHIQKAIASYTEDKELLGRSNDLMYVSSLVMYKNILSDPHILDFGGWTTAACARRSDSHQCVFTSCLHQRVVARQCDCITACSFNPFPCIRSMCRQCAKRLKPPTCKRETPSGQPSSRKSRP